MILIDEVLVARIASGRRCVASCWKSACFKGNDSLAAVTKGSDTLVGADDADALARVLGVLRAEATLGYVFCQELVDQREAT